MADEPSAKPPASAAKPKAPAPPRTSQGTDPNRALYALLFFALLAIGGYFLVAELKRESRLQDCEMAGHRNCDSDLPVIPDR
jgi:hypothetical protein